ncbi:MAG: FtsW/RodA/SpoVE family cell cycle protein [Butyricicoccus sp.]
MQKKNQSTSTQSNLKNIAGTQPVFLFVLFQVVAFLILYISDRGTAYLNMLAPLSVIVFGGWLIVYRARMETAFFLNAALLLTFGTMIQCMLMEEDSRPTTLMVYYCIAFAAGLLAALLYKRMPILASPQCTLMMILLSVLLYMATLVLGVAGAGGVTNWIRIGPIQFQPSEFIKGLYVLIMAGLLCTKENPGRKRILAACLVTLINLGFLVLQGEFGTILLILGTFLCLIFLFVPDIRVFGAVLVSLFGLGAAGIAMCSLLLKVGGSGFLVRQVQKIVNRFAPWLYLNFGLNPTNLSVEEYQNANYQVLQARKALLNSGLFGSDTTTYIPNRLNDSVFPALTESCGILIALTICILFGLLVVRGTRIYFRCPDRYHQAVAAGLTIQVILQAFIIIGGSIGLLPLTGITLPLISLGGSSLIATFIYLAVILAISSGNLWDGRRDYSSYDTKLQKARSVHAKRVSSVRNRTRRGSSVDDTGESGKPQRSSR